MKVLKIIFVLIFMCFVIVVYYLFPQSKPERKITLPVHVSKISVSPTQIQNHSITKTLFVPYWALSKENIDDNGYSQLVYFGITVNDKGVNTKEPGYAGIDQFLNKTSLQKKHLLAVRMIDSDINTQVLQDENLQHAIIKQSIQIAQQKGFDGIVLDFELSAISFDNVTKEISNFEIQFANAVKNEQLQFYTTAYGDTFLRDRPFDIASIASASDGMMIMAYDLHKANGDPGPNFGLHADSYNYDFTQMVEQFSQVVPREKISIIFGMYGYDWQIDRNQQSMKPGVALSDSSIKQKFLNNCPFKECNITRDQQSAETRISYEDDNNNDHIVWFEDKNSAEKKTAYLQSKGIDSIAYWAYSYF